MKKKIMFSLLMLGMVLLCLSIQIRATEITILYDARTGYIKSAYVTPPRDGWALGSNESLLKTTTLSDLDEVGQYKVNLSSLTLVEKDYLRIERNTSSLRADGNDYRIFAIRKYDAYGNLLTTSTDDDVVTITLFPIISESELEESLLRHPSRLNNLESIPAYGSLNDTKIKLVNGASTIKVKAGTKPGKDLLRVVAPGLLCDEVEIIYK